MIVFQQKNNVLSNVQNACLKKRNTMHSIISLVEEKKIEKSWY